MRIVAEAEQAREYSRLLSEKVRDAKAVDPDAGKGWASADEDSAYYQ
ncbi:hypothetical protein ACH4E7_41495 [Kitasatospora sp. NPDC018058]